MPKKGSKRVKTKTHAKNEVVGATVLEGGVQRGLEEDLPPRSIVARASKVVAQVGELVGDLRKLMGPHTASNLKEQRKNRMKDYTQVATQLGVSHIMTISQTKENIVLRVGRTPSGRSRIMFASNGTEGWMWGYGEGRSGGGKGNPLSCTASTLCYC